MPDLILKDGKARLIDPISGVTADVEPERAMQLMRAGYQPETEQAYKSRIEAERYDSPLKAFGTGIARGATLGLSDVALPYLGVSQEELNKIEQYSPGWSTTGEVGGSVLSALLPGGAIGAAGKGAAKAAQGLGRAGSMVARGTAEGAVAGFGAGVSDVALGQRNDVLNALIGEAAMGAMAGGLFGVGAEAVGMGARAVGRATQPIRETLGAKIKGFGKLKAEREALEQQVELYGKEASEAAQKKLAVQKQWDDLQTEIEDVKKAQEAYVHRNKEIEKEINYRAQRQMLIKEEAAAFGMGNDAKRRVRVNFKSQFEALPDEAKQRIKKRLGYEIAPESFESSLKNMPAQRLVAGEIVKAMTTSVRDDLEMRLGYALKDDLFSEEGWTGLKLAKRKEILDAIKTLGLDEAKLSELSGAKMEGAQYGRLKKFQEAEKLLDTEYKANNAAFVELDAKIGNIYTRPGGLNEINKLSRLAKTASDEKSILLRDASRQLERLQKQQSPIARFLGDAVGGRIRQLAGFGIGGLPGAIAADLLGPVLSRVSAGVANSGALASVGKGIAKGISSTASAIMRAAPAAIAAQVPSMSDDDYVQLAKDIHAVEPEEVEVIGRSQNVNIQPELITRSIESTKAGIDMLKERMAKAAQHNPQATRTTYRPTIQEKVEAERIASYIVDPNKPLTEFREGNGTPEGVEYLERALPDVLRKERQQLEIQLKRLEAQGKIIPEKIMQQVNLLRRLPAPGLKNPDTVATLQQLYASRKPEQPSGIRVPPKHYSKTRLTEYQRLLDAGA